MRRDGGEGQSGRERGADGARLPAGPVQAEKLHHPTSEDELLQAVAGGAVPTGPHQVQTHLPVTHRSW